MIALYLIWASLGASILAVLFTAGLYFDARNDLHVLRSLGVRNGRLLSARGRSRQTGFSLLYSTLLVGKSIILVQYLVPLIPGIEVVPWQVYALISLILFNAVAVAADAWWARRTQYRIDREARHESRL